MIKNKNHWYDGLFYDKLIAPNQDKAFEIVKSVIREEASVLDVGCGTGRLSFQLSGKCRKVDGIDLSARNIRTAMKTLSANPKGNIEFFHSGADMRLKQSVMKYDYAVLSYVIHEINIDERAGLLKLLASEVGEIIIVDYLVPRPAGITDFINGLVEFAAGREHYRNFKSFVENGGINGLVRETGLKIIREITNKPVTSHIAVLKG
jgi:SAM-dependent methyltransferase